jgi:uncharacterized membrane protein
MEGKPPRTVSRHLRQTLLTGLAVVLPLFITLWLLSALFNLVDGAVTPWVKKSLVLTRFPLASRPGLFETLAPVIGVLVTLLLIYLAGLLSTNLFGVRMLRAFDRLILRIPVVKAVYGGSKQLLEALSATGKGSFSQVVLAEYPRKGVYTVGFVTREFLRTVSPAMGPEPMAAVFLPTTPNPTSGWIVILPREGLIPLSLSVEEGLKLVVSGGIVLPERWEMSAGMPVAGIGDTPL